MKKILLTGLVLLLVVSLVACTVSIAANDVEKAAAACIILGLFSLNEENYAMLIDGGYLEVTTKDITQATVKILKPFSVTLPLTEEEVEIEYQSGNITIKTDNTMSCDLTALVEGTKYVVKLTADSTTTSGTVNGHYL